MGLLENFVTLWVVIDPIGTIPLFVAVTAGMATGVGLKTALMAVLVSIGVFLFILVFSQILINALGIGLLFFQVAGGIVLFLFALTMIFGDSKQESDTKLMEADADLVGGERKSPAVFPLAGPSLASPGVMLEIVQKGAL